MNLLRNQSFLRLYDLILILYGTQKEDKYMDLLINRLIDTIDDPEIIINILNENGWNNGFVDKKISFLLIPMLL